MEPLRDNALRWLQDIARDVTYGLRTLRRSPGVTLTALLSPALGIGATTGIFSLFDQVLRRPLRGAHEPGRLVLLSTTTSPFGGRGEINSRVFAELSRMV